MRAALFTLSSSLWHADDDVDERDKTLRIPYKKYRNLVSKNEWTKTHESGRASRV
jgi:hypothetical protein